MRLDGGTMVLVNLPELRSPFARAVVPVVAGMLLLAALAGFTWAMAAFISDGPAETSEPFARSEFPVGKVDPLAETVANDGPLLFPELGTVVGTRSIVVDHTGNVPTDGWRVYWAYPADREPDCVVTQVRGTREFTDCDGRTIDVSDLALPDRGVVPRVDNREDLVIDMRGADDGT